VRRLTVITLLVLAWVAPLRAQQLALHFLDVGQGDAALLITPERRTMLVDAGRNGAVTAQYLRALGVDTIDLLVVSHNHDDHMGGAPEVLAEFPVRNYMDNGVPSARRCRFYAESVQRSGARYLEATARTLTLGSVRIRVLPPPDARMPLPQTEQNNRSIGLLIQYGAFRALLTGDSQVEELGYWLAVDSVPEVRVLKAAHHGSGNDATPDWVARTRPGLVVISVGNNGYGHPSPAVVAAWCEAGAMVLRTDWNGSITVRADSTGAATIETANGSATNAPPANACGGIR
jgi:beta-lactamase superfamily II metal-dependent hydrolase